MPAITQIGGLCSTCNHRATCYYRARGGTALFCELFDDYVAPPLGGSGPQAGCAAAPATAARRVAEDVSAYAGLCMNCEHRRSCVHPKPAGGVWHCEDYE
jgi:hypothetical protein